MCTYNPETNSLEPYIDNRTPIICYEHPACNPCLYRDITTEQYLRSHRCEKDACCFRPCMYKTCICSTCGKTSPQNKCIYHIAEWYCSTQCHTEKCPCCFCISCAKPIDPHSFLNVFCSIKCNPIKGIRHEGVGCKKCAANQCDRFPDWK